MSSRSRRDSPWPDPLDDLVDEVLREFAGVGDVDDWDPCEVCLCEQMILDRPDAIETVEVSTTGSQRLAEPAPSEALFMKVDSMLHDQPLDNDRRCRMFGERG